MSFSYKLVKHIATLSENIYGSKQVNIISYNEAAPKMDIRKWEKNGKMTARGVTLDEEEWTALGLCFNNAQKEINYSKILDNIIWLHKINETEYEIDLSNFNITIDCQTSMVIDEEKTKINYEMVMPICEEKPLKCIDFLDNSNRYFSDNEIYANAFLRDIGEEYFIKFKGIIPLNEDKVELMLDEFQQFLKIFSASFNELGATKAKQINFDNVIVIGDQLSCVHEEHKKEELLVSVDFVKKNGDKIRVEAKACYCEKCNLFFMRKHDYRVMKSKAGDAKMLCQEREYEKYYKNPNFSDYNMNDHSVLNIYGYNVNAIENLSDEQRHEILASLVDRNILGKSRIASYLAYFIRLNEGKKKDFSDAINKWNSDRDFILDYKVGSRRKIKPIKITVIKYKPRI